MDINHNKNVALNLLMEPLLCRRATVIVAGAARSTGAGCGRWCRTFNPCCVQESDSDCCGSCEEHRRRVRQVVRDVVHNLTLLAETGYGEGEICHRLVNPAFSQDRQVDIMVEPVLQTLYAMIDNLSKDYKTRCH